MTSSKPRQRKTPRQRAEETLGVAQRRVTTLDKQAKRLQDELEAVEHELADAKARLDYAKKDPALTTPASGQTGATT